MRILHSVMENLKVLMLHGYTQNGQLFHAKTRVLQKHLQKAFPSATLSYPTGPVRLNPADVPGFELSGAGPESPEAYGWWRRADTIQPIEYVGMEQAMDTIAGVLQHEGPFDGVIGFSQGACFAAILSSLLEGPSRKEAFERAQAKSKYAIPFPSSIGSLNHPPFKFCIAYSGFIPPGERYTGFYQHPPIKTPLCHFIGSLDSVVDEKRTRALVDACGGAEMTQVVTHPGGHFVPTSKQFLDQAVAFIRRNTEPRKAPANHQEERVEDMEVPF